MSVCSNVTEQDLINLRKVAEQQKEQRAPKIKNRNLKQTHDVNLAESLSPITKKLEEINKSTEKISEVIKDSNSVANNIRALPNSSNFSKSIQEMLRSLMRSHKSLKIIQDESGRATILGVPFQISGVDTIKINETIYELTPEVHKALSNPLYTGNTMNNDDEFLMLYIILKDVNHTGNRDRPSNRKNFSQKNFPKS